MRRISRRFLKRKKLIGEVLLEKGLVSNQKIHSALVEQDRGTGCDSRHQTYGIRSSIRVSSKKLDRLVDLVGELVTVQVTTQPDIVGTDNPELLSISEEIERLTGEIRDSTMSIRMLPIGTTFGKVQASCQRPFKGTRERCPAVYRRERRPNSTKQ